MSPQTEAADGSELLPSAVEAALVDNSKPQRRSQATEKSVGQGLRRDVVLVDGHPDGDSLMG